MNTIPVAIPVLQWAAQRAGLEDDVLTQRIKPWPKWVRGEKQPTMRQLEDFAQRTHVPLGYFFLPTPPVESLPIPDYRTNRDAGVRQPSPDLLDTLHEMQRRQDLLREDLLQAEAEPLAFAGSAQLKDDPEAVGREMRNQLGMEEDWAAQIPTWTSAVGELRRQIEELGVMAIMNGVVGNNTSRKLDVAEFRGFALFDNYAPLIFVNAADAKSAQMFTLAHELAHIWVGKSALSDVGLESGAGRQEVENWCNRAAAECLVPARHVERLWPELRRKEDRIELLARNFKVSPVVAARRLKDLRLIDSEAFFDFYREYMRREAERTRSRASGGNFYNNQNTRVGEYFASRVVHAACEGRIGFKTAYDLTGLQGGVFQRYARTLGFDLP